VTLLTWHNAGKQRRQLRLALASADGDALANILNALQTVTVGDPKF